MPAKRRAMRVPRPSGCSVAGGACGGLGGDDLVIGGLVGEGRG